MENNIENLNQKNRFVKVEYSAPFLFLSEMINLETRNGWWVSGQLVDHNKEWIMAFPPVLLEEWKRERKREREREEGDMHCAFVPPPSILTIPPGRYMNTHLVLIFYSFITCFILGSFIWELLVVQHQKKDEIIFEHCNLWKMWFSFCFTNFTHLSFL